MPRSMPKLLENWPHPNLSWMYVSWHHVAYNALPGGGRGWYWISFQTHKENILQSWNENLINVSRLSRKCTLFGAHPLHQNIFHGCFGPDIFFLGPDMLLSKLDTFYGSAAPYIQFPNTHISLSRNNGLAFSSIFSSWKAKIWDDNPFSWLKSPLWNDVL